MSFANLQVSLESLPEFAAVELSSVQRRYPRVVLGVALCFQVPALVLVTVLLFVVLVPNTPLSTAIASMIYAAVVAFFVFIAWFAHKAASVIAYAVREHDVIVRSGVFWKKETVQPIRRIQHVEQHQGPIDKRFGLYELKLFSAGTGHFTFAIPGLDAKSAARIKQLVLGVQQDGLDERAAVTGAEGAAAVEDAAISGTDSAVPVETGRD